MSANLAGAPTNPTNPAPPFVPNAVTFDCDVFPFSITAVGDPRSWEFVRADIATVHPRVLDDDWEYPKTGAKVYFWDHEGRMEFYVAMQDTIPERLTSPRVSVVALLAHEAEHVVDKVLDHINEAAPPDREYQQEVRGYLMQFVMSHLLQGMAEVREEFAWLTSKS